MVNNNKTAILVMSVIVATSMLGINNAFAKSPYDSGFDHK